MEIKSARDNVQVTETDTDLIIRVRKTLEFGQTKTGKNTMIATTGGFVERPSGLKINLNVVK